MPLKLTDEDFQRNADKRLARIIRRVKEEKPISARDEALLAQARVPAAGDATPGYGPASVSFAGNWSELAAALSAGTGITITRRAIQEWRRDPRYKTDCPPDRTDSRKDVAAWLSFMVKHGLKRADQHVAAVGDSPTGDNPEGDTPDVIQPPRIGGITADWNKAGAMIDYERNKLKLDTQRGTLLVAAELEVPLGATFVVLAQKFSQFPERIAPQVVGFQDVPEIIAIVRTEIESDLGDLHGARWLDVTLARILDDLPFDAESARLLQLVSFDGQDKSALRELIARVALEALRTIGARAIAEVNGGQTTAAAPQPAPPSREVASRQDQSPPSSSVQTPVASAAKGKQSKRVRKKARRSH